MNVKIRKLLAALMALVLLLGNVPAAALAAETGSEATTTNGYYDDNGNWVAGGNGSATYNADGTDITLSKTATPVAGMENTFDITLKVETSTTTTTNTIAGAVVLVIDVSGSMDFCSECKTWTDNWGNLYHSTGCTHGAFSRVTSSQSRINATKIAAAQFLKNYAGTDASANRQLSIVTFAKGYSVRMDWSNVAGGPDQNGYNAALASINGLSANGGTNLEGGLYTALSQLSEVADYGSRNVVLLTDGAPTLNMSWGDGSYGNKDFNDKAAAQATSIKGTGAKLYTVCFGVANEATYTNGPTVGKFLSESVASSGCAYNADNSAELYSAFAAITESITSGIDGLGLEVTDPMADMITVVGGTGPNFSGSNGTYTWKLVNAETVTNGNVTKYVYTYTYRVTLDVQGQNFEEGEFFPTNEETYLEIDGVHYEFPVPGVKGTLPRTDVSVTKRWEDKDNQDGIRTGSVTVQLKEGDRTIGEPVVLNADNNWTYTWDGETYDLIAQSKGEYHVYTVVEVDVPDGYVASVDNSDRFNLVVVNTHETAKKDIIVNKVWADKDDQDGIRPDSVTVNLLADGVVVATAELNEANGWTYTFAGFDVNKAGKPIVYTVEEVNVPEGYEATYSEDGLTVTNSHKTAKTSVDVTKIWVDNSNQDGIRPNSVTFELYADGKPTGKTLVITGSGDTWTGTFTDLDLYANGEEIVYTVQETEVPADYTAKAEGLTVTNTHVPAVTKVEGKKTWVDNNNQDGVRPGSITINLVKGGNVIDTVVVTEADGWAWSFTDLPKYEAGQLISYTITETAVDGYTTTYNGYNVTNTHTPEEISVTVTKSWEDNKNQDGIRPNEIKVILLVNGQETEKTLVLNEGNGWTGSFTGLAKNKDGVPLRYEVKEVEISGYTTEISGNQDIGYTITNTHTPETVEVSGKKTWVDNDDQDGARPESITINLMKNGEIIDTRTVTEADGWAWSFTDLPKYEAGQLITYSITETAVDGYITTYNGYNVTNTHAPEKTSVTVNKAWTDSNDQDGIRPNEVTVVLVADGVATEYTLVLNEGNNWTGSFTDLDKYADGEVIVYTVEELHVPGYETVITGDQTSGYQITNSHTPATVAVAGSKTWVDADDQDGFRPESITINLLADGVVIDTVVVTEADNWSWNFENLPKYRDHGTLIVYSITEEGVEDYVTEYNGYNVTNTHAPEKTSVTVNKTWADSNDQDGIRPNEVTVVLVADGVATEYTLVLNEGNNWTGSFTDLDKYADGEVIVYTVEELHVPGYDSVISGDQNSGYQITNSHNTETVAVSGSKTWNDSNNQDGVRPESITINLLADGKIIETITVTAEDNWSWSFENLPKYKDHGTEIVYSITEEGVEDYVTEYNGYNVTNTHAPEKTSVTVNKAWTDSNDQDGIRPNEVTVVLVADGVATEYTLVLNEGNNWTGSFTDLDKYADGEVIVYTVEELYVPGYDSVITGDQTSGYQITNSHNTETVAVAGSKTWVDADNQDGFRPESITINLLADGKVIETITVTAEDNWSWSFENLPKYKDHGTLISYSITEEVVEGYVTEYNGYNVTNTHAPEKTSVTVSKTWADSNDQDGIRPNDITVVLLANGEETEYTLILSEGNNWTGSFTDLDKYADGEVIEYEVKELEIDGYTAVITGDQTSGYHITNSHTPETISISGSKTWIDSDNQDGVRPESITINLMGNGEIVQSIEVTEEDNWSWSFEDLPKYENHGNLIAYSITENAVDGYTTTYEGMDVINEHTPEETGLTVTKSWQDNNDQDGIRPEKITVILLANGEPTGDKLVLTAEDNWTGSFTGLDKYADGVEIVYSVDEVTVEGYETVITGDMTTGYTITNSHTPEVIAISGSKTWKDSNNQDGVRPETITINLMANGNVLQSVEVSEADNWAWTFENLPKYENHGTEIVYAITENAVDGYTTTYDGYNVINSYTPMETGITVTKAWADSDDADGLRPGKVTITLYADGVLTDKTLVLTAEENWTGSFVGLPKYANGAEIVYTIGEVGVEGYNTVIRGSAQDGFVVTNSHTYIPQTGDERNPMMWMMLMFSSAAVAAYVFFDSKKRKMAN